MPVVDIFVHLLPLLLLCVVAWRDEVNHREVVRLVGQIKPCQSDHTQTILSLQRQALAPDESPDNDSWTRSDEDEWKIEQAHRGRPGI